MGRVYRIRHNSVLQLRNAVRLSHASENLAAATFTAVASLVVVHRAIFTRLRATRLVGRETDCANHGCQNGTQDLQVIFHE